MSQTLPTSKPPPRADSSSRTEVVHVNWVARDELKLQAHWDGEKLVSLQVLKVVVCESTQRALEVWVQACVSRGQIVAGPLGGDHASMFIREVSLRLRNDFRPPYAEVEMCHCRVVSTEQVDRAVIAGCWSVRDVARETTASTSCGTCRPDVEAWIKFRCESR